MCWISKTGQKEKKIRITFFIGLFIFPFYAISQKIYTVDYPSQSDIKVFVVDYESQSDLKVFKVDYQSQSKGNISKSWRGN